jgi:hypothetical protein
LIGHAETSTQTRAETVTDHDADPQTRAETATDAETVSGARPPRSGVELPP